MTPKPRDPSTRPKGRAKAARRRERDTARFERHFLSEERVAFVKSLPCVRCGGVHRPQWWPIEVHHDPTKSAGGTYRDTSPLCLGCHRLRHSVGVETFWSEFGSYEASNAATQAAWLAHTSGLAE